MAMPTLRKTRWQHIRQDPSTGDYWVDRKIGQKGRRFRRKCGTLKDAQSLLKQVDELAERPAPTKLSEICAHYRAQDVARNNGHEHHASIEARFVKDLKDPKAGTITAARISEWQLKELERGLSPASINRATRRLHAVLNLAVRDGLLLVNPMRGYRTLVEDPGRLRWLNEEEEARGEAHFAPGDWRLVRIAFLSGMRQSEQFKLEMDQVKWDANIIHLRMTKNHEHRDIPMGKDLREAVEAQRRLGQAVLWVQTLPESTLENLGTAGTHLEAFLTGDWDATAESSLTQARLAMLRREFLSAPNKRDHQYLCVNLKTGQRWDGNQFYKYRFMPGLKRAGITDLRWHDLRHTYCSRLAMAGVPIRTIQRLAGHKTITITERYSHLSPDHLHAAARALDREEREVSGHLGVPAEDYWGDTEEKANLDPSGNDDRGAFL